MPVGQLYDRLRYDTTRPLLLKDKDKNPLAKLEAILAERETFYAEADVRIRVAPGETPEEIVALVLNEIEKSLRPSPTN